MNVSKIEEDINCVNIADQIVQLENGGSLGNKVNQNHLREVE